MIDSDQSGLPVTLPGTQRHTLSGPGGNPYWIDIAVPTGDAPEGGWPALYLLDAFGSFGTTVEALRRMARRGDATGVVPMVIVGISSQSGLDEQRRRRDFTTGNMDGQGGAPAFLDFLTGEVSALVRQHAAVDPARQTLFGHSLAGFFTLWAFRTRPEAFRGYFAASPSLWWDTDAMLAPLPPLPADRRVALVVGEWEGVLPPWQAARADAAQVRERRATRDMTGTGRAFAAMAANALGGEQVSFTLLPEEDHASIVSAAIPRALRLASHR